MIGEETSESHPKSPTTMRRLHPRPPEIDWPALNHRIIQAAGRGAVFSFLIVSAAAFLMLLIKVPVLGAWKATSATLAGLKLAWFWLTIAFTTLFLARK